MGTFWAPSAFPAGDLEGLSLFATMSHKRQPRVCEEWTLMEGTPLDELVTAARAMTITKGRAIQRLETIFKDTGGARCSAWKTSGIYSDYVMTLERILVFDPNNMPAAYWLGQGFALGLGRPRDVEAAMRL